MTTAVVVAMAAAAESHGPAALLRAGTTTLLGRVARQLRKAGATDIAIITRPEWVVACKEALADARIDADVREAADLSRALSEIADIAEAATGRIVVAQAEVVTHDGAVAGLLADPRVASGVLVRSWTRRGQGWGARLERGRVVSAESAFHQTDRPNARSLGFLQVSASDRTRLVETARSLAAMCAEAEPPAWSAELARKVEGWGYELFAEFSPRAALAGELDRWVRPQWMPDPENIRRGVRAAFEARVVRRAEAARLDATALLTTALVRRDVMLRCAYLRELFWARVLSQEAADAARAEMASVDEDRVLMESAVKANDGFFGTFFCSPYTKYIARWAANRGITPNQVTVFSFLLGLSAALAFAFGTRAGLITGAVLLYFTLAFDCVDGQLARYSKRFTALGAWLDPMFDRGKEYSVYAALAYGAVRGGADAGLMWLLAGATITLQTARHLVDFSYAARQVQIIASVKKVPIEQPWDNPRVAVRQATYDLAGDDVEEDLDETAEGIEDAPNAERAGQPLAGVLRTTLRRVGAIGIQTSRSLERRRWLIWAKRLIAFPIGERYAAICFSAALFTPKVVFIVMLAWGGISMAYTLAGRTLRSLV